MRIYEIILLISCLALLQYLIFFKKSEKKVGLVLSLAVLVDSIIQLSWEGYRWQMLPIYITACIYISICLLRSSNKKVLWAMPKLLTYALYTLSVLLLAISTLASVYLPVVELPKPEGPYTVGTRTFHFTDSSRDEIFTSNQGDKRELMVQIWYPSDQQQGEKIASIFPQDRFLFQKYAHAYASNLKLPEFVLDYWKYFKSNSYENAGILHPSKPYPLILLSHGEGTGRILHISQAENLASHGYIVAAIDHTYSTTATAFPDGRVTGYERNSGTGDEEILSNAKKIGKVWNADIDYVINQFGRMNAGDENSFLKGALDMNNIGIMGHSFGGATAFHEVQFNPKLKAGVNMDGTLYDLSLPAGQLKPFITLRAEDFKTWTTKYKQGAIQDAKLTKLISSELQVMNQSVRSGGKVMYIQGTSHYNFTDLQLYSKLIRLTGMTGNIDGNRGAKIANEYVLNFFDKQLKGKGGELLTGPSPAYPEVKFMNSSDLSK
ncbi:Platelet-activating factor acetylhydrolase plasma/intracellular isoform II [Paenibacillus zeisoli]|uniref:Platelet-activating factor acetylhydrolase plasma/intracellular isoform II n=1 Tax=Paenibacillus zeisoli TaxID=2496267 RepID=A0A433XP97_9BACL|nr:Platelet-activating factor acetylhydrolase plasma/intracellular isoform II [Paenibacillus zeisoli]RUT35890.1 Platelet-activating factor acetylhydrolase plasma/intracellular isoform II [Paenibacillus zeisoli]